MKLSTGRTNQMFWFQTKVIIPLNMDLLMHSGVVNSPSVKNMRSRPPSIEVSEGVGGGWTFKRIPAYDDERNNIFSIAHFLSYTFIRNVKLIN